MNIPLGKTANYNSQDIPDQRWHVAEFVIQKSQLSEVNLSFFQTQTFFSESFQNSARRFIFCLSPPEGMAPSPRASNLLAITISRNQERKQGFA
jgi:hypothetical protein